MRVTRGGWDRVARKQADRGIREDAVSAYGATAPATKPTMPACAQHHRKPSRRALRRHTERPRLGCRPPRRSVIRHAITAHEHATIFCRIRVIEHSLRQPQSNGSTGIPPAPRATNSASNSTVTATENPLVRQRFSASQNAAAPHDPTADRAPAARARSPRPRRAIPRAPRRRP